MNKKEIVSEIAEKTGLAQKDAHVFLDGFVEVVREAVRKGNDVSIVDFGQFCVTERAARMARDFKTGKPIEVPAMKSVKFKPGKALKEAANG
jgi:DNA-binding protein HU-beta